MAFMTCHQELVDSLHDQEKLQSLLLSMTKDHYKSYHKFEYTFPESVLIDIANRATKRASNYKAGFDALNFFGSFIISALKQARDEDKGSNTDGLELVSRRSDFGQNYRGVWVATNEYKANDVVWKDLDKENARYGSETYFVCLKDHLAINDYQLLDSELWLNESKLLKGSK